MVPGLDMAAGQKRKLASISTTVPDVQLVSIEHPCIVENFDNGFKSLGGEQQVKHILQEDNDRDARPRKAQRREKTGPVVAVSLHAHDPLAKKLESTPTSTHGVLVRVTLPRWTGRKRKLGSDSPFIPAESPTTGHQITAPDLIRRLQDNASRYKVEAIGSAETSHRFDALPDLRIREQDVPVMRELKQRASTPNYDVLKNFHIDLTPGTKGITALPRPGHFIPPDVGNQDDPFDLYRDVILKPLPAFTKYDVAYKPEGEVPAKLQPLVDSLNAYLETRPIVTRLALQHAFSDVFTSKLDAAATWVATKPKDGPWKDCLVKRGVDPTSDPRYRIYQTVAVRPQSKGEKEDSGSHIFDGVTKVKGRTYQYCDITDPQLAKVVHTDHYRSREEGYGGPSCGWYHNGSVAKIRFLMADKIRRMHSTTLAPLDDRIYEELAALPDKMEEIETPKLKSKEPYTEARALLNSIRAEALKLGREVAQYVKYGTANSVDRAGDGGEGKGGGDAQGEDDAEAEDEPVVTGEMAIDPSLLEDGQAEMGEEDVDADASLHPAETVDVQQSVRKGGDAAPQTS